MMKRMDRKNGFTLIELLVVISIIGVLTGLVTYNFQQARVRARDVQRKAELGAIRDSLEMYKNDKMPQEYPDNLELLVNLSYMKELPIDPIVKQTEDAWEDYSYEKGEGLSYTLSACLENASDADKVPDATCMAGRGVVYRITP